MNGIVLRETFLVQTSVAFGLYILTEGDCSSVDGREKQFGIWRNGSDVLFRQGSHNYLTWTMSRSRSPRRQLHEEGGEEELLQEDPVVEECAEVVEVVAERERQATSYECLLD